MLHTVNKSPHGHSALAECLRVCAADDVVVLIEDGVYAAIAGNSRLPGPDAPKLYALSADVAARGLAPHLAEGVALLDYAGFVQLCCEHPVIQSWY